MTYVFPGRLRPLIAAAASLLALVAVAVYVAVPTLANPSIAVAYEAAASPAVKGKVRTPSGKAVKRAGVRLIFRDAGGDIVRDPLVRTDRRGRFSVGIARRSRQVRVRIRVPGGSKAGRSAGRVVARTFAVRPGRSLLVTAVFPPRGSGIFPGLFPY